MPAQRVVFFLFLHLFQGRPFRTLGHLLQQFLNGGGKIRRCAIRGRWRSQGRQHLGHLLGGWGWTGGSQRVQDRRVLQQRFFGRHLFFFWVGPRGCPPVGPIGDWVLAVSRLGHVVYGGLFRVGKPGQTWRVCDYSPPSCLAQSEDPRRPRPPLWGSHPAKPCGLTSSSTNRKPEGWRHPWSCQHTDHGFLPRLP